MPNTHPLVITLIFSFLTAFVCKAQLVVNPQVTEIDMANKISGPGVTITNVTMDCNSNQYGTFSGNSTVGINDGILLTTGLASVPPHDCIFQLALYDAGSDGWDCGQILVYLDGLLVGTYTNQAQFGTTTFPIFVQNGQTISIDYVTSGGPNCDENEHGYQLRDDGFNSLSSIGAVGVGGPIPTGQLYSGTVNCTGAGGGTVYASPEGPNDDNRSSHSWNRSYSDPDLIQIESIATKDHCIMEFDIIPTCDTLQITYVFSSEEYPAFVCGTVNDAFGFFISGPGINGPFTNNAQNLALVPGTNMPVTINTINDGNAVGGNNCPPGGLNNSGYYVDNGKGIDCLLAPMPPHCTDSSYIRYNGMTVPLVAKSPVVQCEKYHMKIIIADGGDNVYDSGVFLTASGLQCPGGNSFVLETLNSTPIEGCADASYNILRTGDITLTETVYINTAGSATSGTDFISPPDSVTFNPGETSKNITFPIIADNISDPQETLDFIVEYKICDTLQVKDTISLVIQEVPQLSFTKVDASCGMSDGSATVTMALPGTAPFTYNWDSNTGGQNSQTASNLPVGTYTVTVIGSNGCASTDSVTITNGNGPTFNLTINDETCAGASDVSVQVTDVTGVGPFTFQINGGASQTDSTFTGISSGTHTVVITDAGDCQSDSSFVVDPGPCCLVATTVGTPLLCAGDCNAQATTTEANSIGSVTYNWMNETLTPLGQTIATANNLCAGIYYVDVTDDHCSYRDTMEITDPDPILVIISPDTNICIGGTSSTLASASGGNGNYTFEWASGINGSSYDCSPASDTVISVIATDGNGCVSNPYSTSISIYPPISGWANILGNSILCIGDSTTLDVNATGGNSNYSYQWSSSSSLWTSTNKTVVVAPTETTTYEVVINDGCETPEINDTVRILIKPAPSISFTSNIVGGCVPVTVTFTNLTDSLSVGNMTWDFGDGGIDNISPVTHTYYDTGAFNVQLSVTTPYGCTDSLAQDSMITSFPYAQANFLFGPQPTTTLNSTIQFTNTSSFTESVEWNFAGLDSTTEENPTHKFPAEDEGYYLVCLKANNVNGCDDSLCQTVIIDSELLVFVPNAFTPDGNDRNETLKPILSGFEPGTYQFYVFNRWGQTVFQTRSVAKAWDGTHMGKLQQQGIYTWLLKIKKKNGIKTKVFKGHLVLLR